LIPAGSLPAAGWDSSPGHFGELRVKSKKFAVWLKI